jgi:hypothetical protein
LKPARANSHETLSGKNPSQKSAGGVVQAPVRQKKKQKKKTDDLK